SKLRPGLNEKADSRIRRNSIVPDCLRAQTRHDSESEPALSLKTLKIVVIDDSPFVREYLQQAFDDVEGCEVIAMAEDGDQGVHMVRALQPDLVILDVSMPLRSGIQVLQDIRKEDPHTVVIMFTADPSRALREICREAGANFYF